MEKAIKTVEDVFGHFGMTYDPAKTLEENNARLSRRVYKDTECGAWAKCGGPGERVVSHEAQEWSAEYAKVDGVWTRLLCQRHGQRVEDSAVPPEVLAYFWPPDTDMQETLQGMSNGLSQFMVAEEIRVGVREKHGGYFLCGSIVEGTDAEVTASEVYLPCAPEDLDKAIEYVEGEVDAIWYDTHGCTECEKLAGGGWNGEVMENCPECGGDGVSI